MGGGGGWHRVTPSPLTLDFRLWTLDLDLDCDNYLENYLENLTANLMSNLNILTWQINLHISVNASVMPFTNTLLIGLCF